MYLSHFGLKAKPFQISSDPGFLWMGDKHREALAVMRYSIMDNKGFLLLTGDVGTGKTTLINALLGSLGPDTVVATIPDPKLSLVEFFQYISQAFRIGDDYRGKTVFLQRFGRFLHQAHDAGQKVLLVVDEAQRLSPQLMQEIRVLSNIERPETKLINIFLVGQNEFREMLAVRQNRALKQRIALNYHIQPLTEAETAAYIAHRLKVAGAEGEIFSPGAVREVFLFSKGYPRLINIVCDHALLSGFVRDARLVGAEIVRECSGELRIPIISPASQERSPMERYEAAAQANTTPAPPAVSAPAPPPVEAQQANGRPPARRRVGLAAAILLAGGLALWAWLQPQQLESWRAALRPSGGPGLAGPAAPQAPPATPPQPPLHSAAPPPPAQPQGVPAAPLATPPPSPPAPPPFTATQVTIPFDQDSNELSGDNLAQLDRLAQHLRAHPALRVRISGHTDAVGSQTYNLSVSRFRANIVKAYLFGKGIAAERTEIEAFGSLKPVADNETRAGREKNRRVEVEVLGG